jgi:toxin CcdB
MSQFDVHRNNGRNRATIPFVVVVQSSFYDRHRRRVVVPLVATGDAWAGITLPASNINPTFTIEGIRVILDPLEMTSVATEALGERVGSLTAEADAIVAALDEVFSRAWN